MVRTTWSACRGALVPDCEALIRRRRFKASSRANTANRWHRGRGGTPAVPLASPQQRSAGEIDLGPPTGVHCADPEPIRSIARERTCRRTDEFSQRSGAAGARSRFAGRSPSSTTLRWWVLPLRVRVCGKATTRTTTTRKALCASCRDSPAGRGTVGALRRTRPWVRGLLARRADRPGGSPLVFLVLDDRGDRHPASSQ